MKDYIKKIIIQKLAGVLTLLGSARMIYLASIADSMVDKNCTAVVILIPIGIGLLLCNKALIELD